MIENSVAVESINDIQDCYSAALRRLGIHDFSLKVQDQVMPIDRINHPYTMLGRLALSAEETAILIFGQRLFPCAFFIMDRETSPTGVVLKDRLGLTEEQLNDKNIVAAMNLPVATFESMTIGQRELIIESSLIDNLEIDVANRMVKIKAPNLLIHSLYANAGIFNDGQALPIMSADMIAINELNGVLKQDFAIKALNKAREKAMELHMQMEKIHEKDFEMGGDI